MENLSINMRCDEHTNQYACNCKIVSCNKNPTKINKSINSLIINNGIVPLNLCLLESDIIQRQNMEVKENGQ